METSIDNDLPFISIVIPTLNRKKSLKACLNSLLKLDYPKSRFEIVVVDGGSSDGTDEMLRRNYANIRMVIDRRDGISYARNTGWRVSRGEITAFTDDDCIIEKNWLKKLLTGFYSNKIAAVGGPVVLLNPEIFPVKFVESLTLGTFSLNSNQSETRLLITANLAVKRKIFEIAKFDVAFGRRKTLMYRWEEDVEFCERLLSLGYKLAYVPTAKVYHNVDPKRLGIKYVITKEFSGGLSHYMVERKHYKRITIGINSLRSLAGAFLHFYRNRSIASFCWLIKMNAMVLASIFIA